MVERIDSFLMNLAKKIIIVFGFFGISRKTAMITWICFASISGAIGCQFDSRGHFQFNAFILCYWALFLMPVSLSSALSDYRDDDVLPNSYICSNILARLFFNLVNPVCVVIFTLIFYHLYKKIVLINFLVAPSILFYAYFLLNQGTRSRHTLKGIVRWLARKVKTALRRAPAPQPLPQPLPA